MNTHVKAMAYTAVFLSLSSVVSADDVPQSREPTQFEPRPLLLQAEVQRIRAIGYSADGKRMGAVHGDYKTNGTVCVWDVEKKEKILSWNEPRGFYCVHISSDGQFVAYQNLSDRAVGVKHIDSRKVVTTIPVAKDGRMRFSPDGKTLATCTTGG